MENLTARYSRLNLSSDPLYRYIAITKRGAGGVPGEAAEQDLLDSPWLQRLRRIHQLQSAWWVFPTAEHSRFQHSLGAMHLAGEWGRHLHPTLRELHPEAPSPALVEETLRVAGLLHDCGHGPFGHFFDENYLDTWGSDHETIGRALITGPLGGLIAGLRASPHEDFAPGESIDPAWIAHLISEAPVEGPEAPGWVRVLKPLLVGPYSADNMDYVPRDSYICGVATGPVDVRRIMHYSFLSPEGLTLYSHGAEALYMFLTARLYLYQQVYFHRTVRRIDLQMREVFRPTMELLVGGNPLERLDEFCGLTEWSLVIEVERWAREGEGRRRELGLAWADIVARRLRWTLVFSTYVDGQGGSATDLGPADFAAAVREALPPELRDLEFEVDVASKESRAVNPLAERSEIVLYDPLEGEFQRSGVHELFQRLPVRMALYRIFARDRSQREPLARAARAVLTRS